MWTAEDTSEAVRPRLLALIEHHRVATGCAMKAVRSVAKKVGASEHWVRRVTGRYGEVKIQAHHLLNILREHVRMKRTLRRHIKAMRAAHAENNLSA